MAYVPRIKDYNDVWMDKDEDDNFEQRHDDELAKQKVKPKVLEELKVIVDQLIDQELDELRKERGIKKGKDQIKQEKKRKKAIKTADKKAKKKAKKLAKKGKAPGGKSCKGRMMEDLFAELIEGGILKKLQPAKISDFIGESNTLRHLQDQPPRDAKPEDKIDRMMPDPSMAQLR